MDFLLLAFVVFVVFVFHLLSIRKEQFSMLPHLYEHDGIKPYGYGYRPYYGYNGYLYTPMSDTGYSRPVCIPTDKHKCEMYGLY